MTETAGIAYEIERKFLLDKLPNGIKLMSKDVYEIRHGWLPGDVIKDRWGWNNKHGKSNYMRAIKFGEGISRLEAQEHVPEKLFREIWPLTVDKRLNKVRFCVEDDGLLWEIDTFLDRHLYLAEIEIPTKDYKIKIPEWLKPCINSEVTDSSVYLGVNLAKRQQEERLF
jgi:adenylate cyclase